ncbi:MAG: DNA cytosine methyltransferase [Gemmataceae bacterium]|nr:DNA cytosine methyltransferase [Gemmataceae bacterium]
MSLGFEQAGFDVGLGIELDGYHVAAHERNFPYGKTLCRSVATVSAAEVFAALGGVEEVDVIFGGPPCQGFSNMGHRDVFDPRNSLVDQFVRLVREVRPRAFAMENVPGMLAGPMRPTLDAAVEQFEAAGYRVTHPVRVIDASRFGVPQKRRRLLLLGLRSDVGREIVYPEGAVAGSPGRPTVWDAIADLPDVDSHPELFELDKARYTQTPKSDYARVMRGIAGTAADYSHPRAWNQKICTGCLRVRHTPAAVALYRSTSPGEMVPSHKLPRLDPAGIAPTLRAGSDSSRGSYTAPRPIHPFEPRCITVREAARLHGFPDWFGFYPLKWHGYRQIGNAVCPPVAHAIGTCVLHALGIRPAKPKAAIELADEFHLPPERPRTLRRIPQVVHYPPVIERLFRDRFDAARRKLLASEFTFADVQKAIADTGVSLGWVRRDTFLSEIARSRNVTRLLEPCLRHGFTIRKCERDEVIGQFVLQGHPEGLEVKARSRVESDMRQAGEGESRGQATLF